MIKIFSGLWLKIKSLLGRKPKDAKSVPATSTQYEYRSTDGSGINLADLVMPYRNRHAGSAFYQPTHSQKIKNKRRRAQFS